MTADVTLIALRALVEEAVRRSGITHRNRTKATKAIALGRIGSPRELRSAAERWSFGSVFDPEVPLRPDAFSAIGWLLRTAADLEAGFTIDAKYSAGRCMDAVGRVFVLTGSRHTSAEEFLRWVLINGTDPGQK